jgi:hypothetical protein
MTRLIWDDTTLEKFSIGVDRGVLYFTGEKAVMWPGLISVEEAPQGSDLNEVYHEGRRIASDRLPATFAASIEAYTAPLELTNESDQHDPFRARKRQRMGFSYRTQTNDYFEGLGKGYKIHLVYNALFSPKQVAYLSLSQEINAAPYQLQLTTTPVDIPGFVRSSHVVIDTRVAYSWAVEELERRLYGSSTTEPYLPDIPEILQLFEDASILKITDNGDGTWTADGPDYVIQMLSGTEFVIDWPSAVYIDENTYTIRSL